MWLLLLCVCSIDYPTHHAEARYYFNLSLQTLATIGAEALAVSNNAAMIPRALLTLHTAATCAMRTGYGYLYPKDACSNWVSVAESFVAMLLTAFMTGVAFVKFARPRPNIIFSKVRLNHLQCTGSVWQQLTLLVAVACQVFTVSQRESSGLEMRFRVVNGTRREVISRGEILEVSFKLILMRVEVRSCVSKHSVARQSTHSQALTRAARVARRPNAATRSCATTTCASRRATSSHCGRRLTALFLWQVLRSTGGWTDRLTSPTCLCMWRTRLEAELVHHIDQASPFFGQTQAEIERSDFVLILMMAGVDQNLHDMIHKQHEYDHESMRWATRFIPMLDWNAKHDCLDLDFDKVSAVVPDPIDTTEEYALIDIDASTQTASANSDRFATRPEAWNVEGSDDHDVDLNQLHFETALSPTRTDNALQSAAIDGSESRTSKSVTSPDDEQSSRDGSDTAAVAAARVDEQRCSDSSDNDDDDDSESKSEISTKTNSDSEEIEKHAELRSHHRIRFDRRSRSTMIQIPRLPRHRHNHEFPESSLEQQPASVTRRRVRFKHHPLSVFSKGLYYRALETSWVRLFVWLVVIYFAVISVTAFLMFVSVRTQRRKGDGVVSLRQDRQALTSLYASLALCRL